MCYAPAAIASLEDWPERRAVYIQPTSRRAIALAIELHGSGLDPIRQRRASGLADLLAARGVAVLLPQAESAFQLLPGLASGFAWNIPGVPLPGGRIANAASADDVGFIISLAATVQCRLGLVDAPLFIAGYSGGARLASRLIASSRLNWTAAAMVAGLRPPEAGRRPPPPTISFHGTDDRINPFAGGAGLRWRMGVEEAARRYAAAQGALPVPHVSRTSQAEVRRYRTLGGKDLLTTYRVAGADHSWPGSPDREHLAFFGPDGDCVDASALISEFFVSQMDRQEDLDHREWREEKRWASRL